MCRIANAPSWELSRKRRNKDGNERKSDVYKEGKRRIQSQASIGLDDYAEEGDHGIAVAVPHQSRPRKRQCLGLAGPDEPSSASVESQQVAKTAHHTFTNLHRPEPSRLLYPETQPSTAPSSIHQSVAPGQRHMAPQSPGLRPENPQFTGLLGETNISLQDYNENLPIS